MNRKGFNAVAYCMEKSGLGMTRLMLGMCEPCGEDRYIICYFQVAMPIRLMWNTGKRGLLNWPIINTSLASLANRKTVQSYAEQTVYLVEVAKTCMPVNLLLV